VKKGMSLDQKLKEKEQERQKNRTIWKPEKEGETIQGKVTKIGKTITPFGEADYMEVETSPGQFQTIFMNVVLADRIREEGVNQGDTIAIKYMGMRKSKKGKKSYRDFVVAKADDNPQKDSREDQPEDQSETSDSETDVVKIPPGVDEPF